MIKYRKGYKYQLAENYERMVSIHLAPRHGDIEEEFITLRRNDETLQGILQIKSGYAWDGPSGPTFDTKNFMEGSLIHDAIYQLIRMKRLPFDNATRIAADDEIILSCKEHGMSWPRRKWVWIGLRLFAKSAANPKHRRKVIKIAIASKVRE